MTRVRPPTYTPCCNFTTKFLFTGMTSLELWCFACITCTFGALLSYVVILIRLEYIGHYNKNIVIKVQQKSDTKQPELPTRKDTQRDLSVEIFLFSCTAGGFALFNVYYWLAIG